MNKSLLLAGGLGLFKNADEVGPTMEPRQQMLTAAADLMHPPRPAEYQQIADMPLEWPPPTPLPEKAPGSQSAIPDPSAGAVETGPENPLLQAAGLAEKLSWYPGCHKGAKKRGAKGGKKRGAKCGPGCTKGARGPRKGITELPFRKKGSVGGGDADILKAAYALFKTAAIDPRPPATPAAPAIAAATRKPTPMPTPPPATGGTYHPPAMNTGQVQSRLQALRAQNVDDGPVKYAPKPGAVDPMRAYNRQTAEQEYRQGQGGLRGAANAVTMGASAPGIPGAPGLSNVTGVVTGLANWATGNNVDPAEAARRGAAAEASGTYHDAPAIEERARQAHRQKFLDSRSAGPYNTADEDAAAQAALGGHHEQSTRMQANALQNERRTVWDRRQTALRQGGNASQAEMTRYSGPDDPSWQRDYVGTPHYEAYRKEQPDLYNMNQRIVGQNPVMTTQSGGEYAARQKRLASQPALPEPSSKPMEAPDEEQEPDSSEGLEPAMRQWHDSHQTPAPAAPAAAATPTPAAPAASPMPSARDQLAGVTDGTGKPSKPAKPLYDDSRGRLWNQINQMDPAERERRGFVETNKDGLSGPLRGWQRIPTQAEWDENAQQYAGPQTKAPTAPVNDHITYQDGSTSHFDPQSHQKYRSTT